MTTFKSAVGRCMEQLRAGFQLSLPQKRELMEEQGMTATDVLAFTARFLNQPEQCPNT